VVSFAISIAHEMKLKNKTRTTCRAEQEPASFSLSRVTYLLTYYILCHRHTFCCCCCAGCFFLVSHINAQTGKGEKWLKNVVLAGLQKAGTQASWSIEVHGNATTTVDDDDNQEESAGPAVYLIFKGEPTTTTTATEDAKNNGEPPAIPIQFFCY
jgi:hypothetical protein